jgi:hypothetical protein
VEVAVAVEDLTYQADQGTPEQLPSGTATQLNEANPQPADQTTAEPQVALPEPAQAADYQPEFQPSTDDEEFLTGPSIRPDEDVTAGTVQGNRVAPHIRAQLPALQDAANAPGASAELQALVSYLSRNS